ncbi:MAG: sugar transferase [Bacteroidetes bacterium]|nr:sugar transferase [Bacteroidota bacterium]
MKRLFDIGFSFVAILVFGLPCMGIVFIIKLCYHHPVLFRQQRMGKYRLPFEILKFQTLINEKPTRLGAVLRRTGLDEIPQFINVLKGDMSIVGPRALTQYDVERLKWNSSFHDVRWQVKPGITGLAQLNGGLGKRISWFWDKKYIATGNVVLDFKILIASFLINIFGKKRVRSFLRRKH